MHNTLKTNYYHFSDNHYSEILFKMIRTTVLVMLTALTSTMAEMRWRDETAISRKKLANGKGFPVGSRSYLDATHRSGGRFGCHLASNGGTHQEEILIFRTEMKMCVTIPPVTDKDAMIIAVVRAIIATRWSNFVTDASMSR